MSCSNSSINLSHSISGYITANEDECDSSQYLSVLSQDLTLEEMNITLTNDKNEESNVTELGSTEDRNPPFIFKVDDTNEIYGVQVARDEDGNLQKYQIQYSENINGELVPMLETIQFLPLDYTEQLIPPEENCSSIEISQPNDSFVVNHEEFISPKRDFHIEHEGHINRDEKGWNIQTATEESPNYPIKNEPEGFYDQSSILPTEVEKTVIVEGPHSIELTSVDAESKEIHEDVGMSDEGNHLMAIQHLEIGHCLDQEELYEETIEENHFEQLFLEEKHMIGSGHLMGCTKDSSQNEIYHILNNISTNPENVYGDSGNSILKETADQHAKTNILKKSIQKSLLKDFINSEQKIVYVQTLPEKENMKVMDIESFIRPNSRSLLKSNQPSQVLKQTDCIQSGNKNIQKNPCNRNAPRTKETKQIYRTKEAKQQRLFMNFINSTTIPQVPERKERLPRKQQIKPLEHPNEDIVVKEMIVSANNFVEPVSAEERKFLPVTEYVELLDSGDESNSGNNKKKRKNNRKDELIEIEISDTDECDKIDLELEKLKDIEDKKSGMSKKRGRPPKYRTSAQDKKNIYPNSPPKMSRFDSDVESVTSTLQVIRMENQIKGDVENAEKSSKKNYSVEEIDKNPTDKDSLEKSKNIEHTVSNEKSSQTDLQRSQTQNFLESTLKRGFDYKFECEQCKSKFINRFLLSRHECIAKFGSTFSCNICKQKFMNNTSLNLHKKNHMRETPMLKPNLTKIPQSRIFPKKEAVTSMKSTISSSRSSTISKTPLKIPLKQSLLLSKNPKTTSSFKSARQSVLPVEGKQLIVPSKSVVVPTTDLVLPVRNNSSENKTDTAVEGCNKTQVKGDISKLPSIVVTPEKIPNSYTFKCETQCDKCSKHFDNNTSWFEHQVLNHGFKTPDKSIGEKKQKKIVKDKVIHNGIRAAPTVAKNFSMLRNKVQHI
ncbi:uncharacterized protein LOC123316151 [Coccinella septempunctata]|uniref:uncharacterized protein LOC123316151 n=1 Tax=Coccinella septempunctata TaxID=41139 RepID=UPI001D06470D|nr:uncharacterized protein LOC123316151 [Coccinella septempunctata]